MHDLQPGDRVSEYVLDEPIGRGTFGQVWKAHHHVWQDRLVAVKIPTDAQYVLSLRREGVTIHGLQHANIVRAINLDPYADVPYFVMEFVEGLSLRQLIDAHPHGLPVPAAETIFRGLLLALGHAHANGVIHRDVKPANVLIAGAGRKPLEAITTNDVKVVDFGLGQTAQLTAESMAQSTSLAGDDGRGLVGTLVYMAPEQRSGERTDERSDLYAAGVVLFEMLTGRHPAGGDPPSHLRDGLPAWADRVYARLYTRWERRFTAAAEVLEAIGWAEPISAAPAVVPASASNVTTSTAPAAMPEAASDEATSAAPAVVISLLPLTLDLGRGISMDLLLIPAGEFWMGSPDHEEDRNDDETRHLVRISQPFYMCKYEVTQAQWEAVMGNNPAHFKGRDLPVENVSWIDCQEFCDRLSRKVGRPIRLPTEAEWEYACRAGTTTPFHPVRTITTEQANDDGNDTDGSGASGRYRKKTTQVGMFPPNTWGLYDMHGNVWEWCHDWYGPYPLERQSDPQGPTSGEARVVRGGSWLNCGWGCRAADRNKNSPVYRGRYSGFRVVSASRSLTGTLGDAGTT